MSLEPGDRSYPVELAMRVAFVRPRPGGVVIDGLSSGPRPLRAGTPLSLDANLPQQPWAFAAAYALGCWEAQGTEVTVRLQRRRGALQARISGEPYTILLDLSRLPAGLEHPAVPWGRDRVSGGGAAPVEPAGC